MPIDCLNDNVPVYDPDDKGCYRWMSIKAGKPSKFCAKLTIEGDINVPEPSCITWDPATSVFEPPLSNFLLNPDPPHGLVTWHDKGDRIFTHDETLYLADPDQDPEHEDIDNRQIIEIPGATQAEREYFYKLPVNVNTETPLNGEVLGGPAVTDYLVNTNPLRPSLGSGSIILRRSGLYRVTMNLATSEGLGDRTTGIPPISIEANNIRRPALLFKIVRDGQPRFINRDDIPTVTPQSNQPLSIIAQLNSRSEDSQISQDDGADDHVSCVCYINVSDLDAAQPIPWSPGETGVALDIYYSFVDNGRPDTVGRDAGWVRLFDDRRYGGSQIGIKWICPYTDPAAPSAEFGLPPYWFTANQYRASLYRVPFTIDPADTPSTFRYRPV